MDCNAEMLQTYLDRELEPEPARELEIHLAACRPCRQELSRLKLLWLELGQPEETLPPPDLAYLRQQAVSAGLLLNRQRDAELSYWQTQKLAWQPLGLAMARVPGTQTIGAAVKAAEHRLPRALSASWATIGKAGLKALIRRVTS